MSVDHLLFALLRAEICGAAVEDTVKNAISPEAMERLYAFSGKHDLAHIAGQALGNMGLLGGDTLSKAYKTAARKVYAAHLRMESEYGSICRTLEDAKIPFIPLKGAVLRQYYPEPWLRNSCDIDILVKPETLDAAVAVLQEKLMYTSEGRGDHDVSLFSDKGVHLELHFDLMEDWYAANSSKDILCRVWEDATPQQQESCHFRISDELFYFYHMAHMAKHFQAGGCGIRPFLDVWVLDHRVPHDPKKRDALLAEGGLLSFALAARKVSRVWFGTEEPDALTCRISDFILRAGVYGNEENRAAVGQAKSGGKLRYLVSHRIFVPYEALKAEYPVLSKHKWLTPAFQPVRWVRMLREGKLKRALKEWNTNMTGR